MDCTLTLKSIMASASLFLYVTKDVINNPINSNLDQESPNVIFSLSILQNISKMIDEANRCPSQTGSGLCPWTWVPDIVEHRIPRVIYKAQKLDRTACESNRNYECLQENKRFNVVHLSPNSAEDNQYFLIPGVVELPVSMICTRKVIEYVVSGGHADFNSDHFD